MQGGAAEKREVICTHKFMLETIMNANFTQIAKA